MFCAEHPSKRSLKGHPADAPYYRREDWWKNPDGGSEEENSPPHENGYTFSKKEKQNWSIVVLSSGFIGLTAQAELETIFNGLAKTWREATGSYSLNMRRYAHPTYQVLMHTLGKEKVKDVVPIILRELQRRPDVWFEALKVLTKKNPAIEAKTFDEAVKAWLDWGKREEYIA